MKEVVDPDNAVAEVREANNSRTATLRVWDAP
jgi:subtilase family serine protease